MCLPLEYYRIGILPTYSVVKNNLDNTLDNRMSSAYIVSRKDNNTMSIEQLREEIRIFIKGCYCTDSADIEEVHTRVRMLAALVSELAAKIEDKE